MHHIDMLLAERMEGYSQTPSDHLWLLIESKMDMEDGQKPKNNVLNKLLEKFRITHS